MESGGDATKIFRFTKATPKQISEQCLTCHAGDHPKLDGVQLHLEPGQTVIVHGPDRELTVGEARARR